MREKLNQNPMVQLAVIGVLIVVVGFIFLTRMKSSSDTASTAPTSDPAATATGTNPVTADPASTPPVATDPATGAAIAPPATGAVSSDGSIPTAAAPATGAVAEFKAGPGLPKPVVKAYNSGNAVAILVTKNKGFDDRALRKSVSSIKGKKDVDLFKVRVQQVPKYSQITQGVDLDRVPALIVIRPKRLTGKQQPPMATISYGYRTRQGVVQAVQDQLYDGKILGYAPK